LPVAEADKRAAELTDRIQALVAGAVK
jgi:hypothetical protein